MNEDIITIEQAREERRFRGVAVNQRILADVFKGGCYFKRDLPEDIQVEAVYNDHARQALVVILVSPRFEPVSPAVEIPIEDGVETFYLDRVDEEG